MKEVFPWNQNWAYISINSTNILWKLSSQNFDTEITVDEISVFYARYFAMYYAMYCANLMSSTFLESMESGDEHVWNQCFVLSTYAKFSEKLTFLSPRYALALARIREVEMLVFRNILHTYVMDDSLPCLQLVTTENGKFLFFFFCKIFSGFASYFCVTTPSKGSLVKFFWYKLLNIVQECLVSNNCQLDMRIESECYYRKQLFCAKYSVYHA